MELFKRWFGFVLLPLVLLACNPGKPDPAPPTPTDIHVSIATTIPTSASVNLAVGKKITASASLEAESPEHAIDGNLETQWNAGYPAPQWIQIDLQAPVTVTGIRLTIAQAPSGMTTHQVLAGAFPLDLKLVHEFSGTTADNQTLEWTFQEALVGIRYIEVRTTQSPSWVAWKEIEIFGDKSEFLPTLKPQAQTAEVIYFNGQIITMEKDRPTAQALAIKGNQIVAVGDETEVMTFKGDSTRLVDLKGLTMTPGFIDSHAHRIGDRWHFGDVSAEQMMDKALAQGWTSIYELFVNDQRLEELKNLDRANALPIRVSMYLIMNSEYQYTTWWQAYQPLQQYSSYLQIAGLKITLDREWGEQIFFDQSHLDQMVLDASTRGWQVATHSFSPRANGLILNAYGKALKGGPNEPYRFRLEHTGVMTDEEVRQMADLGIIGSVQFISASTWIDDASFRKYIPASEVQHSARWRDMLNAGIFLIGNTDDPWCCTDWRNGFKKPAQAASVVQAIYQGVTRKTFSGRAVEPWQAAQVVTVQEALEMLTIDGAYAAHLEDKIGSLKIGKYADLVILSENPLIIPVEQIPRIEVIMTMVGGDVKYCASGYTAVCRP